MMSTRSTQLVAARHEVNHAVLTLIAAIAVTAAGDSLAKLLRWIREIAERTEILHDVVVEDGASLQKVLEAFIREFSGNAQAENAVNCAHVARQKLKRYLGILRREG